MVEATPPRDSATTPRYALPAIPHRPTQPGDTDPPVPEVIDGRYEVGRMVGQGATARVYRAWDRKLGRDVAIKLFLHGVVEADERRRAQEIRILSQLQHPGLVTLHEAGTYDGHPFLAMRLVEGPNLADRILSGPLFPAEVTQLGIQLATALAYVHDRGITHRDLKPANVLLGPDGPLISDFGIAQALDATRVTLTGMVVGTAAYMAPEQVLSTHVGPPADVYSLGLVLLECLTGSREYVGTMVESAVARLHRPPAVPEGLPNGLTQILRQMTAKDSSARPSARDCAQVLADPTTFPLATMASSQVNASAPAESPSSPRGRASRKAVLAIGMPAMVAAIATTLTLGPNTEASTPPSLPPTVPLQMVPRTTAVEPAEVAAPSVPVTPSVSTATEVRTVTETRQVNRAPANGDAGENGNYRRGSQGGGKGDGAGKGRAKDSQEKDHEN